MKSDFDAKNTNDECVFHPNLVMFDVCYTHLYTTVTISKKPCSNSLSLSFFHHPYGFVYVSNSATPDVGQANEDDKYHVIEN